MIIGKRITELREEKGMTQGELAKKVDVHLRSVSRWEHGEAIPGAEDVMKLAKVLGVTADYLLFENAPRDGRVDIDDVELLNMFEEISTMDEDTVALAKQILDSLLFKKKVAEELGRRSP